MLIIHGINWRAKHLFDILESLGFVILKGGGFHYFTTAMCNKINVNVDVRRGKQYEC